MNKTTKPPLSLCLSFVLAATAAAAPLPNAARFGDATMSFDGQLLRVSTGAMAREWRLTDRGLITAGLFNQASGRAISVQPSARGCDWSLPEILPPQAHAQLASLTAGESDDDGFSLPHLAVDATFDYPGSGMTVRYSIWAYPDAPGLRTQLWLKGAPHPRSEPPAPETVDFLPVDGSAFARRYFGYYNDTQHRNDWAEPLLRESVTRAPVTVPETNDWASGACFERPGEGVMLVKESQKCVNQPGVETGAFIAASEGLSNTGLRLKPGDLTSDHLRWAWASWCIVYDGSDAGRELALKRFYAIRFPIDPARDVYAQANTFGSGGWHGISSRDMAKESEVLPEIDSVADLGLDSLQLDNGWEDSGDWRTVRKWRPDAKLYPEGWRNLTDRAARRGISLGLWAPAMTIPLDDMEWNYTQAHFRSWKLDFARFRTADEIDANIEKVRRFIAFTGHRAQIAWDVTENAPRYGYYWARDYGCIWLANRKPGTPAKAVYKPDVLLRDLWQLAKYTSLNKVQVPVQNVATIDRGLSNAWRYGNLYAAAIGLTGVPCFFETTRLYSPVDRDEIRLLFAEWKLHRAAMAQCCVFPVGDVPAPGGWAAFQYFDSQNPAGYLLIFRDWQSTARSRRIPLRFLAGKTLSVENLRTHQASTIQVDGAGTAPFLVERPADFLFARYAVR